MDSENRGASLEAQTKDILKALLGSLELEVMGLMWSFGEATVPEVAEELNRGKRIAYTTVMTVMGHLVDKGLLTRNMEGKKYLYKVALTRQEFIRHSARRRLRQLIESFGDIAIAQFVEEVQNVGDDKLERLKRLAEEAGSESDVGRLEL